jgi:hypothetical protein
MRRAALRLAAPAAAAAAAAAWLAPAELVMGSMSRSEATTVDAGPAVAAAAIPRGAVDAVRAHLAASGAAVPAHRFDAHELARHAAHTGVHAAPSEEAREAAAVAAAARVAASAAWWQERRHSFLDEDALSTWTDYVRWAGVDARGRPVLLVRAGAAARATTPRTAPPGRRAPDFAHAVVSACEAFASGKAGSAGAVEAGAHPPPRSTPADQMVVVLDAGGAGPAAAARAAGTVVDLARTFAAHYPGRLAALHLARAPAAVAWPLKLALPALHRDTGSKVRVGGELPPGAREALEGHGG